MNSDSAVNLQREKDIESLGLSLSDRELSAIYEYLSRLAKWNQVYNLTAIKDPRDMWSHHIMDCLSVIAPLRRQRAEVNQVLDVGSGGGLPGVILSIMGVGQSVTCVDAVGKKAAFVNQLATVLTGLPARLVGKHSRVEQLQGSFDLITSRAFSSLIDLTALTHHLLTPDGVWMAMKGKRPDDEIADLPSYVKVFHVEQLEVPGLNQDRCLVWMRAA